MRERRRRLTAPLNLDEQADNNIRAERSRKGFCSVHGSRAVKGAERAVSGSYVMMRIGDSGLSLY